MRSLVVDLIWMPSFNLCKKKWRDNEENCVKFLSKLPFDFGFGMGGDFDFDVGLLVVFNFDFGFVTQFRFHHDRQRSL
jgi:hypothetical protein